MESIGTNHEEGRPWPVNPELYLAAWCVVLTRHIGVDDASEVAFSYLGEEFEACHSSYTLSLVCSSNLEIGKFLQYVKQNLETLPVPLRHVENSTELPEVTLKTATGDQHTATSISADSPNRKEILLAHFHQAVSQLQSLHPSTHLGDIDIACAVDRQYVLRWNGELPPRVDETLCGLFDAQMRQRPSATAVASWDGELSYVQLDDLSAKLASEIVRRHTDVQKTIALCFDKSLLAVIAMLAVLRARAAFVNLGIALPHKRQTAILSASEAVLLIVDRNNEARLIENQNIAGLLIDMEYVAALPEPIYPLPDVLPSDAAAITFTSGSTGAPKGIMVEHGSIATSCDAMANRLDLGTSSRVLQFASYTFDAAVGDIFYALSRGAVVCIPSERERVDDLAAAARKLQVNWAFLTPSVLSLLEPSDVPSLRRLLVGGEKPDPKHIDLWSRSVSLHLAMGPAECAIYCAASQAIQPGQDVSTFGQAAGCRLWVVDENDHSKLAPVGCVGEMVVEGRIVARGYLNDPERSAAVFLNSKDVPWLPAQHESRLYKSGDLVRLNPDDGSYYFVSRKDNQVKLHGQRVELSEIELHLKNTIPGVDSALVLLNTSAEHANRYPLVCFLIFERTSVAMEHTLGQKLSLTPFGMDLLRKARDQLAVVLPGYMVPTLYVPIDHVPFTSNGKRDTKKLRAIAQSLTRDELHVFSLSQEMEPAKRSLTRYEEQLRDLWAQVLCIDPSDLGPDSNFIREGGDSLAAMHLVSAAIKTSLHLQVSTILLHPGLSDMASEIRPLETQTQHPSPAPFSLLPSLFDITQIKYYCSTSCSMDQGQIEDIYPATPLQNQLWTGSQRRPGTYILQMAFELPLSLRLETFQSAWNQVIRTADILRTRLVSHPHMGLLQVVSKEFEWDYFNNLDEFKTHDPFALMEFGQRLARLALINSEKSPIFVFAAHHVLYDAFMLNMIFSRISEICKTGQTSDLSSFKNFVSYVERRPAAPAMSFWKTVLDECPSPSWPPASPPDVLTTTTVRRNVTFSTQTTEFTVATFAQAAFSLLLGSLTRTNDVIFSTTFSGRDADVPSILDTAGPTLYTVPFRMRIAPDVTLRSFFDQIRGYIRDSAPYGHIGLPAIARVNPCVLDVRCVFSVQPSHVIVPEEIFGPRISFREEMGRLPLIFEVFVGPKGAEVVAEYNTGSLRGDEVQSFVERFGRVLIRLLGMGLDENISRLVVE